MERGLQELKFVDFRRRGNHFESTTVTAIKQLCDKVSIMVNFLIYIYYSAEIQILELLLSDPQKSTKKKKIQVLMKFRNHLVIIFFYSDNKIAKKAVGERRNYNKKKITITFKTIFMLFYKCTYRLHINLKSIFISVLLMLLYLNDFKLFFFGISNSY